MEIFVVDTHSLVWFITRNPRLSGKAGQILRKAERAETEVLIPTIVLAELLYISERRRVPVRIGEILRRIERGGGFTIVPFDFYTFNKMKKFPRRLEIHDRIIAATAVVSGAKIITCDPVLQRLPAVETLW